eukprot:847940_1
MYPLFNYLAHQPMEIGKRKTFHSKLYAYCCDTEDEFDTKLIIANYVCVKSYFHQLKQDEGYEQYYQFAKWLFELKHSDLRHITLETFRKKANSTTYHKVFAGIRAIKSLQMFNPSIMVFAKVTQLSTRMIMVLLCLGLDIFYLKLFANNNKFMQNYGNVLSLVGVIVTVLFVIWFILIFVVFESCKSKWDAFSSNMICSTHHKFVLMMSSDEFIETCDSILYNKENDEIDDENQEIDSMDSIINMDVKALPYYNVTEEVVQFVQKYAKLSLYSLRLISTILIAVAALVVSHFVNDIDCLVYHSNTVLIYIRTIMIISIAMCLYAIYRGPSMILVYCSIPQMVNASIFALYLSGIAFWGFTMYFRNDVQCELQIASLSVLGLLFIGCEFVIASLFLTLVIGFLMFVIGVISLPFMLIYRMVQLCCERYATDKKVLLIGSRDAGASTLFETFKLFLEDHGVDALLTESRSVIRQNCISGILILLEQSQDLYDQDPQHNSECLVEQSEEVRNAISLIEIYESESFARYLRYKELHDLRRAIDKIWRLDSVQTTFSLRDTEYHFPVNLDYFFDKINEIMMEDYTPAKEDALKCKMHNAGTTEHKNAYEERDYKMIDCSALSNDQFDTFDVVLFVAALDHYNIITSEDNTRNAMHETIALFDEICNSQWFKKTETILLLNRDDLFRGKLRRHISLSVCFSASVGWEGMEWEGPDYTTNDDFDECYGAAITFIRKAFSEIKHTKCHVMSATSDLYMYEVESVLRNVQSLVVGKNVQSIVSLN